MKIPNLYKDRREEGDTRLRQCQLVQLHLLHVFDAVCKEHNLRYFLGGGTLLGAMRHNGFIPWDDDIDVGMPLSDYKKFLKLAGGALPEDVSLQTPDMVPERIMSFAKLRDAYSFHLDTGWGIMTCRNNGIFLDVFPYYEMPNIGEKGESLLVRMSARTWTYARRLRLYGRHGFWQAIVGPLASIFFGLVHKFVHLVISALKVVFKPKNLYLDINFVYFTVAYPIKSVFPTVKHIFEDAEFPVPNDADTCLRNQYGDWHKLPPVEKRAAHGRVFLPFQHNGIPGTLDYPRKHGVKSCDVMYDFISGAVGES